MMKNKYKRVGIIAAISTLIIGGALFLSPSHNIPLPQKTALGHSDSPASTNQGNTKMTQHGAANSSSTGAAPSDQSANVAVATSRPSLITPINAKKTTSTQQPTTQIAKRLQKVDESASTQQAAPTEHHYYALGATPNDTLYAKEWQLQKINTPTAWNTTTGKQVIVADIDTGYALDHEDLKNIWYQNPGETGTTQVGDKCWTGTPQDKSTNNCDDDGNGYVDDWRGWNFYGKYQPTSDPCATNGLGTYVENNSPLAGQSGDDVMYAENKTCFGKDLGNPYGAITHGTNTAGLAGAQSNNGVGIATTNWNTKIMPLQALGDDGSGWTSDIAKAIHYAVDNGAQIINMSLGGPDIDPTLQEAVNYAYSHNVVIVAAAGNCGTGTEPDCDSTKPGQMVYPALYPHVIAVGATDSTDARASFSSYGRGLDVVAPGYGTLISPSIDISTTPFNMANAYSQGLAGTSFASPLVASLASLIRAERPTSTVNDVVALIDATAQKVPGMNGAPYTTQYGHGLANAGMALTIAATLQAQQSTPVYAQTGSYISEHTYTASTLLSSGCTVSANSYCTVRWTEPSTGFERFLPYQQANTSGQTAWSWNGDVLGYGEWTGLAESGDNFASSGYWLFAK